LENSRKQFELDSQKKIQELLTETQYLSENFRHEVAKRTEIQQKLISSELIQKQFDLKEKRQQEAIHKLEQKNRELGQSCIEMNVNLQQEIEHLRGEKNQLQQVLEQRTVNTEKLQSEIAQLIAASLESKESYQKTIAEVNALKPQINALETDKIRLQGEVQSQTEQLIQETVRKEQAIAEIDALTQAIERLESEKKQLEQELVTSREQAAVKETEIIEAEPETAEKTVEIAEIENIEPIPTPVEEVLENPPPVMDAIAEIPEVLETSALQAEPLPDLAESPPSEVEALPDAIATPVTTETPPEEVSPHSANFFADKKFIIVGTLSKMNREQAKTLIQDAGGIVTSSPSSKTHYVLVGKSPGDKLKKAQKLGISQLTESKFLTLLGMDH
jgi:epidermal growth factor receptor substrate 15